MILKSLLFLFLFLFISTSAILAQKTYYIFVSVFGFIPADVTISIGDTVQWQWISGDHTTTSDNQSGPGAWNALINDTDQIFKKSFDSAGVFGYSCTKHMFEGGKITVNDAVPVELTAFSAEYIDDYVLIKWETATETNNQGFNIERQKESGKWNKISFIEGKGTSSIPQSYSFSDKDYLESGKYYYRLKQIDFNGTSRYYNKVKIEIQRTDTYELMQNFPNPFNPTTNIRYRIPEKSYVEIDVYNILGNKVTTLISEEKPAGYYETTFDGTKLSSGIYYLQMIAGNYKNIIKMILIR